MDIAGTIRTFIHSNFPATELGTEWNDATSFLESGLVDSTGVLEIVEFVEETFGIYIDDDDLVPENLDSVANLTGYVTRKLGAETAVGNEGKPDAATVR